jgi:hypothetical protein
MGFTGVSCIEGKELGRDGAESVPVGWLWVPMGKEKSGVGHDGICALRRDRNTITGETADI